MKDSLIKYPEPTYIESLRDSTSSIDKLEGPSNKTIWMSLLLIFSLLMERFCFAVTVYKTKFHGYVLILSVILISVIFHFINSRRLFDQFRIERTPRIGICVIIFISVIDLLYAFFLFWPANVIPISMIVVLLQLFIPINMVLRRCCVNQRHYKIHMFAGLIILLSCVITTIQIAQESQETTKYIIYFLCSQGFKVLALSMKEAIVRSQPLNRNKFNFKISVGQFLIGIIILPIIMAIQNGDDDLPNFEFIWKEIQDGFICFGTFHGHQTCNFSLLFAIGYVAALFGLEISLSYLMENKSQIQRYVFALAIPLTIIAFLLGIPFVSYFPHKLGIFDFISIGLVAAGVFVYNWFDEKPCQISIENI